VIRFIAALDNKQGIANEHGIPWQGKLPTDVAYFRRKTIHGSVMMGQGWYVEQKKPLSERRNLVATSNPEPLRPGFERVSDARAFLEQAKAYKQDIWVGGGAGLFASTLDLADELYLTHIQADFHCAKFFPNFKDRFELRTESKPQTENDITFSFQVWQRKG